MLRLGAILCSLCWVLSGLSPALAEAQADDLLGLDGDDVLGDDGGEDATEPDADDADMADDLLDTEGDPDAPDADADPDSDPDSDPQAGPMDGQADGAEPSQSEAAGDAGADATDRPSWSLQMSAGAGFGMRGFDLPEDGVVYHTRSGLFPAVGLGFALDHWLSDVSRLGLLFRYQTSVALELVERRTDSSEQPQTARAHRLELGLSPTLALDAEGQWALSGALGYSIHDLRPLGHLLTPAFHLAGPFLRVALWIPIGDELLRLRLGPEAQWIAQVGRDLRERGVSSQGLGVGGEAALDLLLGRWTLSATYREWHSWLDASQGDRFVDSARFMTLRVTGAL